jgi:hypothetical protein
MALALDFTPLIELLAVSNGVSGSNEYLRW